MDKSNAAFDKKLFLLTTHLDMPHPYLRIQNFSLLINIFYVFKRIYYLKFEISWQKYR